ncbi:MAG: PEPxxWA-CTERM sorting domain-containing protein [Sphingomonas sp.]|nr:PEPxxWA-CTERM sorting domain-containing protein [Sphingomonas sp.]
MGLSGLDWTLGAGSYFVSFEAADSPNGFNGGLGTGVSNPLAHYAFTGDGGLWHADHGQDIALRIEGTAGALSAAPEPASWAMMLIGFGAVGGAMRTRSRRSIAAA